MSGFQSRDDTSLLNTLQISGFSGIQGKVRLFGNISDALADAPSIDNYIFTRAESPEIVAACKIAIAQELLKAEKASALRLTDKGEFGDPGMVGSSWYPKFFTLLNERVNRTNIHDIFNNVSIINFNYDRSIKQYLFKAIRRYYELDENVAAQVMLTLNIMHPYGNLGSLEWEPVPENVSLMSYGFEQPNLIETIGSIRTFTESVSNENGILSRIGAAIGDADKLIFLGFAYHEQNTDLLASAPVIIERKQLTACGSAYGLSERSKKLYQKTLTNKLGCNEVDLDVTKCADFFDQFHGLLNS